MPEEKKPAVVVGAFIRDQNGNILLVKSVKWPGLWVVGGGHVEYGETIKAAIEREVLEEYGLEVEFQRIIKVAEFINSPQFIKKDKHFIAIQCECLALKPEAIKLDDVELQEYQWFTLKEASELTDIVPTTGNTIKEMYAEEYGKK